MTAKIKPVIRCLILGILAGIAIGLGGVAYIACAVKNQTVLGSIFFSVGLLMVCGFSLNLYTGKIGFIFEKEPYPFLDLLIMYLGNIIGALLIGIITFYAFGQNGDLINQAYTIASSRLFALNDFQSYLSSLLTSFLCGILVFLAVYSYKNIPINFLKIVIVILCVAAFVISGFQHCIANMTYFASANIWSWQSLVNIVVTTIGNSLGSLFIYSLFLIINKLKEANYDQ